MSFLHGTLSARGICLVCKMSFLKIFSLGIIICSISGSYSNSVSITLDFIHGKEYKVSMSSDSINRSETFYKIEEFPQKLNDVTDGLLSAESVVDGGTYCSLAFDCTNHKKLFIDFNNKSYEDVSKEHSDICTYTTGWHRIEFRGVKSNNSKQIKLIINGTDDSREKIELHFDKNIVYFPDITVNHPCGISIRTRLDHIITYYDNPLYTSVAYTRKQNQGISIEPNTRVGFITTPDVMKYSKSYNFNTTPSFEVPKDLVISRENFAVNCK